MLETGLLQLVEIEYCDSDVVDIIDLVLQSYQILIISCYLLVRLLVDDYKMFMIRVYMSCQ